MKPRLFIIDGHAYIYRAFYAIPYLTNSKGMPTNAVYGFTRMLHKIIDQEKPEYIALAFDAGAPTFRHQQYADYKAQRPKMPQDLICQLPYIKQVGEAFSIEALEMPGYEADDIIGTLAKQAVNFGVEVVIVSGDKDTFQLVDDNIKVFDEMRGVWYDREKVKEKFGVEVEQMVDMMALMGDSADNVPGVPGIGAKTAVKLIRQFGGLENILANVDQLKERQKENLCRHTESARLSKQLVTICTDVPISFNKLEEFARKEYDTSKLVALFREMGFISLIKEFGQPTTVKGIQYHAILTMAEFQSLLSKIRHTKAFAIDLETTGRDPMLAEIVGISLCFEPGSAYYIPLGHRYTAAPPQLSLEYVLDELRPLLTDPAVAKYGQNAKYDMLILKRAGLDLTGLGFDTMVASYVLAPTKRNHNLQALALEFLCRPTTSYKDVVGTGVKQINFAQVDIKTAADYSGEDAEVTFALAAELKPMLTEAGLDELYQKIELPLVEVLVQMEENGVLIDPPVLERMSVDLDVQLEQISRRIYGLAGLEFNIDSPKQLAEVLFDKLQLPVIKRTKTGPSTNEEVLIELALLHELPTEALEYRKLRKLKNTYVDVLPQMINPNTGRLHTSFNQTITATGRLSSSEPNLQNIPIRTDWGQKLRKAFVPEPGWLFLAADYSQIELRVLAHMSGDPKLVGAFLEKEDIHRRTAAEVFGVDVGEVDADMRRKAKVINFGIVYGMGAHGLSRELGISRGEAKDYIDGYFARYPVVAEFIENTINEAREQGYVSTLFGRRRAIPELSSKNRTIRQFGERTAINSPIQGTAADIIKLAMLNLHHKLKAEGWQARMILQVHDELIFEAPETEMERLKCLVAKGMEGVAKLAAPLVVNLAVGHTWADAK